MILPLYRLVVRMRRTAEYRRFNAMKSQQVKKKRCRRRKRRCQVCTALRCIQAREERGCPCVSGRVNAFGTTRIHAWNAMCSHRAQTIRTVEWNVVRGRWNQHHRRRVHAPAHRLYIVTVCILNVVEQRHSWKGTHSLFLSSPFFSVLHHLLFVFFFFLTSLLAFTLRLLSPHYPPTHPLLVATLPSSTTVRITRLEFRIPTVFIDTWPPAESLLIYLLS